MDRQMNASLLPLSTASSSPTQLPCSPSHNAHPRLLARLLSGAPHPTQQLDGNPTTTHPPTHQTPHTNTQTTTWHVGLEVSETGADVIDRVVDEHTGVLRHLYRSSTRGSAEAVHEQNKRLVLWVGRASLRRPHHHSSHPPTTQHWAMRPAQNRTQQQRSAAARLFKVEGSSIQRSPTPTHSGVQFHAAAFITPASYPTHTQRTFSKSMSKSASSLRVRRRMP